MDRNDLISSSRRLGPELKAAGVVSVSLFGSPARGEADPCDVDVAVRLAKEFSSGSFDDFYQLDQLEKRLSQLLGCKVDVVAEPVRKPIFQHEIDRDRALAF